ncbi:MAG: hypothetical protein R3D67_06620 [Hyphomicrobiaceae bacterium]
MKYAMVFAVAAALSLAGMATVDSASAGEKDGKSSYRKAKKSGGGYSYDYSDTINTYGDSRSLYGSTQSFRDPMLDRQTNAGPFDHGFFFESGIAPRGGNSPYMN